MWHRVYRQIKELDSKATVTIATSKEQVSIIHNQLGKELGISVEPCRRDTFPAIALATAYLVDVMRVSPEESVVVCPVDPYVEREYFEAIKTLTMQVEQGDTNLLLMGVVPTYPSEKYGYIIPENRELISSVLAFKEKPNAKKAEEYIKDGALWNCGVFGYKLKYVMQKAKELIGFTNYYDLLNKYDSLEKISFDYAVVEYEKMIKVQRFFGEWKDLGTWNTLTEAMQEKIIGKGSIDDHCNNVHILNEMDVPVLAMGLQDVVISASPEGILVSDKMRSSFIKPYVERFDQKIRFAEKSWGSYQVIDIENGATTIKVTLLPGHSMNYNCHQYRDEVWVVIDGTGTAVVDNCYQSIKCGDVVTMKVGQKHTVIAETELKMIEVQLGSSISASDKHKFELGT